MTHKEFRGFIGLGILLVAPLIIILVKQCTNSRTERRLQEDIEMAQEADSLATISKARADSASVEAAFGQAPEVSQTARTGRTSQTRPKKNGTKKAAGHKAPPADMSSPHDRPVESGR